MEQTLLSLDFWQDTVTFSGQTFPTGSIGCDALNISEDTIRQLSQCCQPLQQFLMAWTAGSLDAVSWADVQNAVLHIFELLHTTLPFSCLDQAELRRIVAETYTAEAAESAMRYHKEFAASGLSALQSPQCKEGLLMLNLTQVLAQLGPSLTLFRSLLPFAETLNAPEADRTPQGLADAFDRHFSTNTSLFSNAIWLSMTNATVQYAAVHHADATKLVKRMHFVSFVGLFRADLFEGLCVGHAPKKCPICGRWFLTTNARHTKYCNGLAPGDPLHRTCRQVGNLKGRTQRELAADHPLKQLHETRRNSINRAVSRGQLDAALGEQMKNLAKNHMLRAISDNRYAQSSYEQDMELDALRAEALSGSGR